MAGSGRCRGPGAALGVRHRGSPRAVRGAPASGRVQLLSTELSPVSLLPGLAGFPLTALCLRPGRLPSQPLPPRLASPMASSCLGGFFRPHRPPRPRHPPLRVPSGPLRSCVGLGPQRWHLPFHALQPAKACPLPPNFFLFTSVLSEGWQVTGLAGALSPHRHWGGGGAWSVRSLLAPARLSVRCPGHVGVDACRPISAPCAGHRRIRLGTGFSAEAVWLPSRAGSCVGGELMSVCACPRRQTGPRAKALFPRRVAGPLPEGHPPVFTAG